MGASPSLWRHLNLRHPKLNEAPKQALPQANLTEVPKCAPPKIDRGSLLRASIPCKLQGAPQLILCYVARCSLLQNELYMWNVALTKNDHCQLLSMSCLGSIGIQVFEFFHFLYGSILTEKHKDCLLVVFGASLYSLLGCSRSFLTSVDLCEWIQHHFPLET